MSPIPGNSYIFKKFLLLGTAGGWLEIGNRYVDPKIDPQLVWNAQTSEGAMSTRKGNVIRLVDLIDEATRRRELWLMKNLLNWMLS